jgi:hypothetical protein
VEGETVLQDGQDLFLRLNDNFYDAAHIQQLLQSVQWYSLEGQRISDGPTECKYAWSNHITSGFVKVDAGYNLPAHEDSILAEQINHPNEFYCDWLYNTGNRKCAIMIPMVGDFANTYTDLYDRDHNKLTSFSLADGPVLYPTSGDILHGVNNQGHGERITYQLSFKETYDDVSDKISALGFT